MSRMSLALLTDNLMSSAGHQNVVYFPRTGHAVIAIIRILPVNQIVRDVCPEVNCPTG